MKPAGHKGPSPAPSKGGWIKVTSEQIGCPELNGDRLRLCLAIQDDTWSGRRGPSLLTDEELASRMGWAGNLHTLRSRVQRLLSGRRYRKGRYILDAETGKPRYVRDGEEVTVPGLYDLGFVEASDLPNGSRQLALTVRWYEYARLRVAAETAAAQAAASRAPETPAGATDGARKVPRPIDLVDRVQEAVRSGQARRAELCDPPPMVQAAAILRRAADLGEAHVPPVLDVTPRAEGMPAPEALPLDPPAATVEDLAAVLGRHFVGRPRRDQAEKLLHVLRNNQTPPYLLPDGSVDCKMPPFRPKGLTDAEKRLVDSFGPQIAELLKAESPRAGAPSDGAAAATTKAAPRVAREPQIRAMIARLPLSTDADCEVLADALVDEFQERDREKSRETYLGLGRDTMTGKMPPDVMLEALEAACGRKVERRGACFIEVVKSKRADLRKAGRIGGRPS